MKPQYLVVDAAALVKHTPLWEYGKTLCSVPEVITEIRDKEARRRLEALPFPITMRQPQPQSIKFVNEFSKKTGDYASLSLADIKVLALTYELEVEVQGSSSHLNSEPRKIVTEGAATKASQREIFNVPPEQCMGEQCEERPASPASGASPVDTARTRASDPTITEQHIIALDTLFLHYSYIVGYALSSMDLTFHQVLMKQHPQLCTPLKDQSKCEDKDASHYGASHSPLPHIYPHLSRWAKHITSVTEEEAKRLPRNDHTIEEVLHYLMKPVKGEEEVEEEAVAENYVIEDTETDHTTTRAENTEQDKEKNYTTQETAEHDEADIEDDGRTDDITHEEEEEKEDDDDGWITCENIKKHKGKRKVFGAVEEEEEEKDVKVACITGDFAVQNVLKHIGLAVMGVDGRLIRQLKTFILRCHACFRTTSVMDKIFCPHCGNKTLKKVSVTLDPDGTQRIWINTKKPINKRGTKYSLPTPKGGKHGRNPILVADQREAKKYSSKMSRKKINPLHEDYNPDQMPFAVRDVYSRAAQLGYIGGKNHHHFYWEKRNPNEPQKRTGKK